MTRQFTRRNTTHPALSGIRRSYLALGSCAFTTRDSQQTACNFGGRPRQKVSNSRRVEVGEVGADVFGFDIQDCTIAIDHRRVGIYDQHLAFLSGVSR